jgi:hypothetical protein
VLSRLITNVSAVAVLTTAWNTPAQIVPVGPFIPGPHAILNEIQSANDSTIADYDGDYSDWIELKYINLSAYGTGQWLSDDAANLYKWLIPNKAASTGDLIIVWASDKDTIYPNGELHTNFKIQSDGEDIYLTGQEGTAVEVLRAKSIPVGFSYGRAADGWRYFTTPTPGAQNGTGGYPSLPSTPVFSHDAGFHSAPFQLELTALSSGPIRYTLDGSVPDTTSLLYSDPIPIRDRDDDPNILSLISTVIGSDYDPPTMNIEKATVVRARVMYDSVFAGPTLTRTYFVDAEGSARYELPVVSLVTDSVHLFSAETGIYVAGDSYDGDYWRTANFSGRGIEWERPVHFEFFDTDGALGIAQDAGVRINGNFNRRNSMKGLKLYARSEYGDRDFDYAFFPNREIDRFETFLMRNSGEDRISTTFRDAVLQSLAIRTGLAAAAARQAVVFFNGEYWGIHNIRERYDAEYLQSHFDVDPDSVDLLEFDRADPPRGIPVHYIAHEGDSLHHIEMMNWVASKTVISESGLTYLDTYMDVAYYARYMAAMIYFATTDWPGKNIVFWRTRNVSGTDTRYGHDGRWRWILKDLDGAFGFRADVTYDMIDRATATDGGLWNYPASTLLFRRLLTNDRFRTMFASAVADLLNTTLRKEPVIAAIDSFAALAEPEIAEHVVRWRYPPSATSWRQAVDGLRTFAQYRPDAVRSHVVRHLDLGGPAGLTVTATSDNNLPWHGTVKVNSVAVNESVPGGLSSYTTGAGIGKRWTGRYFRGMPVRFEAIAPSGYHFKQWSVRMNGIQTTYDTPALEITPTNDISIHAVFALGSVGVDTNQPVPFALAQNFPNPFNPVTTISFSIPTNEHTQLSIYNIAGQHVRTLINTPLTGGPHHAAWDGRDDAGRAVASGVYFYRLTTPNGTLVRRLTLLR